MRNHDSWLDTISQSSRRTYERAWGYFEEFLGDKNEDWVLKNKATEDWGSHLVDFHRWVKKQPKTRGTGTLSDNSARQISGAIRGYMVHVGLPLSLTQAQKDELTKVERMVYTDYVLDLKTKEDLLRKAEPTEEYIVSAGISFGLRISDFVKITRGMLEPLIDKEPPIQLPKIQTKKVGEAAFPIIDSDAQQAIKRLLAQMDYEGRTDPDDFMIELVDRRKSPENAVNTILQNLAEKAGLDLGNYRLRFHCLRKFLTDKLAGVCSQDKWKWFVGKRTDGASPYVSSEGREAYKLVMRFTQVNGNRVRGTIDNRLLEKQLELRDNEISLLKNELVALKQDLENEKEERRKEIEEATETISNLQTQVQPALDALIDYKYIMNELKKKQKDKED